MLCTIQIVCINMNSVVYHINGTFTIVYSTHYPNLSSNSRIIEIIKGHYQIDSIIIYHNNFLSHATELFHKWRDGDGWLMFSTTIMRENGSFSLSLSLNSEHIVV